MATVEDQDSPELERKPGALEVCDSTDSATTSSTSECAGPGLTRPRSTESGGSLKVCAYTGYH